MSDGMIIKRYYTIEVFIPAGNSISRKGYMTEVQEDDGKPCRVSIDSLESGLPEGAMAKLRMDLATAKKNHRGNARLVYVECKDVTELFE